MNYELRTMTSELRVTNNKQKVKRPKFTVHCSLFTVLLVGFLLRAWNVGNYPPLLWDEAALGYNAYSILRTGKDEYGKFFPVIFKSFGDYKPGLYVYLTVPFIAIFGLNELAVRLPSVIFGSLLPLGLFLLVREIFEDEKLALLTAAAMAFLPWGIHFSRGAWEVNVMTTLLTFGSYLFIKSVKALTSSRVNGLKNKRGLLTVHCSLLTFLFALWAYQGAKMMVPAILGGLLLIFFKVIIMNYDLKKERKEIYLKFILHTSYFILFSVLWYFKTFSGPMANRLKVMSLLSYKQPQSEIIRVLTEDNSVGKNLHYYVFHNEYLFYLRSFSNRYFNYFSPKFLAFESDWSNSRHSAPYIGIIGHINFILLVLGLLFFLSKRHKLSGYFLLYWLMVAPIPAALSRDIISGVRALPMIAPIAFFIGYGLINIKYKILDIKYKKLKILKLLVLPGIVFFLIVGFFYWCDLYFVHMVKRSPKEWLYGYKEAINFILKKRVYTINIFFTDFYGQPYIYYLFYSRYDPKKFQVERVFSENKFGDVGKVEKLGNLEFKSFDIREAIRNSQLFVISEDEVFRQGVDRESEVFKKLIPLGKVGDGANFYGYGK